MIQRGLQLAFFAGDLAELVIGVDFLRVDLVRPVQMFERFGDLSPLKVNQTELDVRVGVARVDGRVMQKAFEILLLPKSAADAARRAGKRAAEIHVSVKKQKRREKPRRYKAENVHAQ